MRNRLHKLLSLILNNRLQAWNYGTFGPGRRPTKKEREASRLKFEELLLLTPNEAKERWGYAQE